MRKRRGRRGEERKEGGKERTEGGRRTCDCQHLVGMEWKSGCVKALVTSLT